ncbi:MAG TPA: cell division protein ZipA C-terminal FtsZ-binding domain-containing protein [Castellaniella sp.]|uniref:cell division protein ZipA C-terminal FtsZ-binding domain-containing protein n=1 Tax=Castellaniella sp. TaxID=1955812 RepID=UPI002EE58586
MSDLQILLISIGVVLIAIVLLYNGWQDWRVRRKMRDTLPESEHDALMQDVASPVVGSGTGAAPVSRREPGIWSAERPSAVAEESPEVDPACEAVIDISLAHPVAGDALIEAIGAIARVGKKPVRVFAESEGGGHRTEVSSDESYVSLQLAVVLANRSGPLSAIEWSNLWTLAQNLAERFEGLIEAPDQDVVLKQAADLDARCASMDAQVGLLLQLASPRAPARILDAAREVGFVQARGQWAWMAENGTPRFILQIDSQDDGAAHRVDLVLDVPNSLPDDQAFSRMVGVARDLASRLDAHVLDDQGRTFQDSSAPAIDRQISGLYDQLDQAGFLAGTERAARVFS